MFHLSSIISSEVEKHILEAHPEIAKILLHELKRIGKEIIEYAEDKLSKKFSDKPIS